MLRGVNAAGVALRFVLALLCGGIIGLERESKRRSAGFRTHTLVCIGATLTTLVGLYLYKSGLSTDPTRLGAQVISGMGFLGAGTIIVTARRQVKGLTTAAGLWTSAIIGLAIGAGYYEAALIGVAIVLLAALVLSKLEYFIMASAKRMNIYVEFNSPGMLDRLVEKDTVMTEDEKKGYISSADIKDIDQRERALQSLGCYRHMREKLYPHLRTVRFDFHLHRKGMVKDTVHTTVLDSTYMNGVQAIRDRDYETALTLLRPYNDYNTAIAYLCMDYNASALQILESLEKTAQVNYMLAVLYSRKGDEQKAVEYYVRSCSLDPSYVHRGNLDPEISVLIRRYGLNVQPEDELEFFY